MEGVAREATGLFSGICSAMGAPRVFIVPFSLQAARLHSFDKVHNIPKKHHLTFPQRTWRGAGGCVVGRKADANVKMEKDKTCKKRTVEGCLTFPCGQCPLAAFQRSLSPPAGDRHVFPGQPCPLSTDRLRNAICKLPAEVEGVFAKTVDRAKLLPDQNPAT